MGRRIESLSDYESYKGSFFSRATRNIAKAIVEKAAKVREGQRVLIVYYELDEQMQLVRELENRSLAKGATVKIYREDLEEDAIVVPNLSYDQIRGRFQEESNLVKEADVVLLVYGPKNPEAMKDVPEDRKKAYLNAGREFRSLLGKNGKEWTIFRWPTRYEAQKEGISYDEYFKLVMEACDQPWEEIEKAQERLIEKLDNGEKLRFVANEDDPDPKKRTDVTMSIKDMTFGNSTIDINYPGSEVFSAPVLNSVNGQIYAEGEYVYDSKLMKNVSLRIKDGEIVEAAAEEGNNKLQEILSKAEGARYFGEVALGTNPGLTRRFFNPLLNEKVSGSFHMAIGHCYEYTKFNGKEVNVNNGNTENKSSEQKNTVHWDLTVLMHRKPDGSGGGKIILDGQVIQEDGKFLDPELAILNPKI